MSVEMTAELKGLARLQRKLGHGKVNAMIKTTTLAVAEALKGKMSHYPGPVKYPIQWASEKQRRWWFATRREQGLGPYRRQQDPWSQRLGPSITAQGKEESSWETKQDGLGAIAGTPVTYAKWVQSKELQTAMHRNTGWITDEQAVREAEQERVAERVWEGVVASWVKEI